MKFLKALTIGVMSFAVVGGVLVSPAIARGPSNAQVQQVIQGNFATRQSQLRAEISAKVNSGQMSPGIAGSLYSQLDAIDAQVQQDIASGGISDAENQRIIGLFGSVTTQVQSGSASGYYGGAYQPYNAYQQPNYYTGYQQNPYVPNNGLYNSNYLNGYPGYVAPTTNGGNILDALKNRFLY